jgi:hypothetical protein
MFKKYAIGMMTIILIATIMPAVVLASSDNSRDNNKSDLFAGNFTDVKAKVLDMINKQIATLQGTSTNVTAATNMTELRKAMKGDRGNHGMKKMCNTEETCNTEEICNTDRPHDVVIGSGFNIETIINANDTTFSTVKTNLVETLQNITTILDNQKTTAAENNNTAKVTQITEMLDATQELSTKVNDSTTTADLQDAVLIFLKSQIDNSIDNRIVIIQDMENNTTANTTKLDDQIANLNAIKTSIDNATTLSDLKIIMDDNRMPLMGGMGEFRQMNGHMTHPMMRADCGNNTCNFNVTDMPQDAPQDVPTEDVLVQDEDNSTDESNSSE